MSFPRNWESRKLFYKDSKKQDSCHRRNDDFGFQFGIKAPHFMIVVHKNYTYA